MNGAKVDKVDNLRGLRYVSMLDAVLQRSFVVDSRSAGTFEFVLEDLRRVHFACVSNSKGQCVI